MLKRVLDGFNEIGIKWEVFIIQSDSMSAIRYANHGFEKGNSRPINIRFHYVQDLLEKRELELKYVKGIETVSDFLTKPLAPSVFKKNLAVLFV